MPRVVECLAAAKMPAMLTDDCAILTNDNTVGVGLDLNRAADSPRGNRIFVIVKADQAGLRNRGLGGVKAVERTGDGHELRALRLENLPDRAVGQLGVVVRLGISDALVKQPGIQLLIARHPQPWREETLADDPNLVLDLPLLPAGRRRAGNRLDQIMTAHLQKAAVELTVLAEKHGLDRGFHVVVDAAGAAALKKGKGAVVGVEDHLLGLARIGPHERHSAVA